MHLWAIGLAAISATVSVDPQQAGPRVPDDYVGLCVSRATIDGDSHYRKDFVPGQIGMVRLARQVGIRHFRVISGTADPKEADPKDPGDDDAFFGFVRAIGVTGPEVIYSLHLFNGHEGVPRPAGCDNRTSARYIWAHYRDLVQAFAFDNEVDWKHHFRAPYPDPVIRGYALPPGNGYRDEWERERAAIVAAIGGDAAGLRFAGPDTGSKWPVKGDMTDDKNNTSIGGVPFTLRFALDEASRIGMATQHIYCDNDMQAPEWKAGAHYLPGDVVQMQGGGFWRCEREIERAATPPAEGDDWARITGHQAKARYNIGHPDPEWPTVRQLAEESLAPRQVSDWARLDRAALKGNPQWPAGLPYRLTEASPYSGGRYAAAQNLASGLEGLDLFHWFAAHGCDGIDPFNRTAQTNAPIYWTGGEYWAAPYAYGMKAFGLAASGRTEDAVRLSLPGGDDGKLTAYAQSDAAAVYVTIINKTFDLGRSGAEEANVQISLPEGFAVLQAQVMRLVGDRPGDATVRQATLGGARLSPDQDEFGGKWSEVASTGHGCAVAVPAASAVIVKLTKG